MRKRLKWADELCLARTCKTELALYSAPPLPAEFQKQIASAVATGRYIHRKRAMEMRAGLRSLYHDIRELGWLDFGTPITYVDAGLEHLASVYNMYIFWRWPETTLSLAVYGSDNELTVLLPDSARYIKTRGNLLQLMQGTVDNDYILAWMWRVTPSHGPARSTGAPAPTPT